MAAPRLSDAQKQELLGRFRDGESSQALAEHYGCSANTVTRVVKGLLQPAAYEELKRIRSRRLAGAPAASAVAEAATALLQPELSLALQAQPAGASDPWQLGHDSALAAAPAAAEGGAIWRRDPATADPSGQLPGREQPRADAGIPARHDETDPAPDRDGEPEPLDGDDDLDEAVLEQEKRKELGDPEPEDDDPDAADLEDADLDPEDDDFGQEDPEDDLLGEEDLDSDNFDAEFDDGDDPDGADFRADLLAQRSACVVIPWSDGDIPDSGYLLVDKTVELQALPLAQIPELGLLAPEEEQRQALVVYTNPRQAKRLCGRSQRVIRIPDTQVLARTAPYLLAQGISRVVIEGSLYALPER
ncbi:MAG: hypothetical protein VKJ44_09055 [Synechococcus sp.]|nr:hypothetical protein [Synechococcus sp.]